MTRKPQLEKKYPKIKPKNPPDAPRIGTVGVSNLERKYPKIKLKNPLDALRVGIT